MKIVEKSWIAAPKAVTPFCHGSSILPLPSGDLLAAWFGGTWEAETDTGIWMARRPRGQADWSPAELVVPPEGHAHGNPVLIREPGGLVLLAYFRNYGEWCTGGKSFCKSSQDEGRTWSQESPITDQIGILTKNKAWIRPDGAILLPVYNEWKWQAGVAISTDRGRTWHVTCEVGAGTGVDMIQGSLVEDRSGRLHMFMRTRSARVYDAVSTDGGRTWGTPYPLSLANPNSGIDAVGLKDGRILMAYNPSTKVARDILNPEERNYRYPLCVAVSNDEGATWEDAITLESEPGEYSYPAIVVDMDGLVHISYTYQRTGIRHVVIDPE